MIGIYKFTNRITGESYIGQSTNIKRRYNQHKTRSQSQKDNKTIENTYFHRMIRYYGFENFDFKIIEECEVDELKDKEIYYIAKYQTRYPKGYNITAGGDMPHYQKLNQNTVNQIIEDLEKNLLTEYEIAQKYSLHFNTICQINVGNTWKDANKVYPIRQTAIQNNKEYFYCSKCRKKLFGKCKTLLCQKCYNESITQYMPSKDELVNLLTKNSFLSVGKLFGVSDNAVRKWCDKYNIPRHASYYRNVA
jgi:group I intron endonuclease